jgi:hypothetical protein
MVNHCGSGFTSVRMRGKVSVSSAMAFLADSDYTTMERDCTTRPQERDASCIASFVQLPTLNRPGLKQCCWDVTASSGSTGAHLVEQSFVSRFHRVPPERFAFL